MVDFRQIDAVPRRELKYPRQVDDWQGGWERQLKSPGKLVLIGSAGLLWHAAQKGIEQPLSENSMEADPITQDDEVAELCYEAHIGSPFEREKGWHITLMPAGALDGLPASWPERTSRKTYDLLSVEVAAPEDLLFPKMKRGEARDLAHYQWALYNGLIST